MDEIRLSWETMEKLDTRVRARQDVAVVIPSLEPGAALLDLVRRLQLAGCAAIVIVDDGSGPDYRHIFDEAAGELGCHLIHHARNQGKGRALRAAFAFVLEKLDGVKVVVTADADGQHLVEDILHCADRALELPDMSMVLGSRNFHSENVPVRSKAGNVITRRLLAFLCGVEVSDSQTGLRAISRSALPGLLTVAGDHFEFETNMLVDARRLRILTTEVPVSTVYLDHNESSHFRPLVDSWRIYYQLLRFGASSTASSAVDLGLFTILVSVGHAGSGSARILWATVCARVVSATVNYALNGRVFHARSDHRSSLWRYVTLAGGVMLLSGLIVQSIHFITGLHPTAVKVGVDGLLFFVSYGLQQKWVFAHHAELA